MDPVVIGALVAGAAIALRAKGKAEKTADKSRSKGNGRSTANMTGGDKSFGGGFGGGGGSGGAGGAGGAGGSGVGSC